MDPSLNRVSSEAAASGRHRFATWGHDAKITKIGVIPTGGPPNQGMPHRSQDSKLDLQPISRCMTQN